jgi:hypothetical protein
MPDEETTGRRNFGEFEKGARPGTVGESHPFISADYTAIEKRLLSLCEHGNPIYSACVECAAQ